MRKKILLFFNLFLISALTTGCKIRMDSNYIISKDGSVESSIIYAYDNEGIDQMIAYEEGIQEPKTYTDEERWRYLGLTMEESINYSESIIGRR